MKTECSRGRSRCKSLGRRKVITRFHGGDITSDGGALLLRGLEARPPTKNSLGFGLNDPAYTIYPAFCPLSALHRVGTGQGPKPPAA